ncbi:MAG: response regulator [Microcoleus sp. CSU_2_2]|nr:response regulator [Microcoleus sp. SU_5_3]NJS10163.1 response regulator [Microcoleus sp. CSU_2_2]
MSSLSLEDGVILIVDDNPNNLSFLFDFLTELGFKVLVARTGVSALQKAEYSPPDLILLDVVMPEVDGFETCRRLKARKSTKEIPIIFMTALNSTEDKVKAFSVGAVDYVTKPIQNEEVLARVKAHLSISRLTKKLQEQNAQMQQEIIDRQQAQISLRQLAEQLEKRVAERTAELSQTNDLLQEEVEERQQMQDNLYQSLKQLQETQILLIQNEKMSALGRMLAGVSHEINKPVNFIYGNLDRVSQYTQDILNILNFYQQQYPQLTTEIEKKAQDIELELITKSLPKLLESMQLEGERIRDIVHSLQLFSRQEGEEMKPINIHEGIDSTLMILQNRLKFKPNFPPIEVIKEYNPYLTSVECCRGEINQVFMNILVNAIDAIEECSSPKTSEEMQANPYQIRISTEFSNHNTAIIRIFDSGVGIGEEVRDLIFDPFFSTKPLGTSIGIGLSISWHIIVERHGGILQCISTPGQGTEFAIELPIHQQSRSIARVLSMVDKSAMN